jgi:hypothetical protein
MPIRVKLAAALRALGLTEETVDFDHDPPLQLRIWVPEKGDTHPPANDPAHIVPRPRAEHDEKTSGRRTKARAEGDVTEIAKTKRLAAEQEDFRRRLMAKEPGREREKSRRWPKRKMGRGKR